MHHILGQDRALDTLRLALRSGRFHHAWIFSGPRGVGKFSAAVEIARLLLDPDATTNLSGELESDPQSRTSRMIAAGTHPDLHVIRKELALYSDDSKLRERKLRNIPIDLLRERVLGGSVGGGQHEAAAYRTAVLGHGKVFIIDEAELLDETGQNAMLKTLEEPPSQTWFFLITNQPDRLLPTIRSRCQHARFARLDASAMRTWLKRADLNADAAALEWAQQFADGSPGTAKLALEYGFHNWQQVLDPMLADIERGKFAVAMGDAMDKLVSEFAETWVKNHGSKNTSKDAANKEGAKQMFALLGSHARRRLAACCEGGEEAVHWLRAIDLLHQAEIQLDSNVNMKLLLENLVVQWAAHEVAV